MAQKISEIKIKAKGIKFLILPEYYDSISAITHRAKTEKINIIAGYAERKESGVVLVSDTGMIIRRREKRRLTVAEQENELKAGDETFLFKYKGVVILPIICYEIVYPIDYYHFKEKIDFVTHHVYSPMFDIYQYEGFRALEQAVGQHYQCPVFVSCGNPRASPCQEKTFNLTKNIQVYETEEFTDPKFNQYRKYGF